VKSLIIANRNLSRNKISYASGIPKPTVSRIMKKSLNMTRKKNKLVHHSLSEKQKKIRLIRSIENLKKINEENKIVITGDESWVYLSTNSDYKWYFDGEERDIALRKNFHTKKYMVTVFMSRNGAEHLDVLDRNIHINSDYFLTKILKPLTSKLKSRYGDNFFLHFDNAPVHKSKMCTNFLKAENISMLE
jgi:hypothetical protein